MEQEWPCNHSLSASSITWKLAAEQTGGLNSCDWVHFLKCWSQSGKMISRYFKSMFDEISMRLNSNFQQHYFISSLMQSPELETYLEIEWSDLRKSSNLERCNPWCIPTIIQISKYKSRNKAQTQENILSWNFDIFIRFQAWLNRLELLGIVSGILVVNLFVSVVDISSPALSLNARKHLAELS